MTRARPVQRSCLGGRVRSRGDPAARGTTDAIARGPRYTREMATQRDVTRIALSLPDTVAREGWSDGYSVVVKGKAKGYCWTWKERVDPKKARVANPKVLAIRTADLDEKDALLASDPDVFFTEPHYNGYPAVLVRLERVTSKQLRALLTRAHETQATPRPRPRARRSKSR